MRHGYERGSVTMGGRRVPIQRPRVRAADGSAGLPVPAYELFSSTEILGRMALERMSQGLRSKTLHHRSRGCLLTNAVSGALVRSATTPLGQSAVQGCGGWSMSKRLGCCAR